MPQLEQKDVEFLLNQARIKLPGSSDGGIKTELFSVMKEFLKDSNSWIEHQQLMVTAGKHEYLITPKENGQIIRLIGVRDGNRIPVAASMPKVGPTGQLVVHQRIDISSVPQSTPGSLTSNAPWTLAFVKNVDLPQTANQLPIAPSFALQQYSGVILDGILGHMMMEQAKSYTNASSAMYHLKRFRDGIGEARNDAWNQNMLGGARWVFPQNFATHNQRGGSVATWPGETH